MQGTGGIRRGAAAAFLVTAACLAAAVPALAADATVAIGSYRFTPASVTIDQGDSVMWRWAGPDTLHDVLSDPGLSDSFASAPDGNPGPPPFNVFGHTFTQPGTFGYYCSIHPSMRGTVVVQPVAAPPAAARGGVEQTAQGSGPHAAVCTSTRNFRIRIRPPRGETIIEATVTVNRKQVDVRAEPLRYGWRFTAPVDLRGLPKGTYAVQIEARTAGGRTLRGTRSYRTCTPKVASAGLPRL